MDKCRVCGGGNLEQFLDLGLQPYCNSFPKSLDLLDPVYPLRVWFCHGCTAVQLDHTIPKEEMFLGDYKYVSGTTKTLRDSFQDATNRLIGKLNLTPSDLIVDIGSNDGTWLKCYPQDYRRLGVEPSNTADIARKSGINTVKKFFNLETAKAIVEARGFPKLITAAGVFLHLEELHSVVKGIRFLLSGGGTFYLQTMYIGDMIKNTEFDVIYHEHLNYWSLYSLSYLFDKHGLEINNVGQIPIHGGSLELWITKKGARVVEPTVDDLLQREFCLGLGHLPTYQDFASKIWRIGNKLLAILEDYRHNEKIVFAFGAPAKGATLLNSFHIDRNLVDCAVERNELKVGSYIPGTGIPILDEKEVYPPDAYLILPWNFLPEFLIKKRDYIMDGGEFIVPIPEPLIINKDNYSQFL